LNIFANHINWKFVEGNFNSNETQLKLWLVYEKIVVLIKIVFI
jgi:hypothetical protein